MKRKELLKLFPEKYVDLAEVNPLRVAEEMYLEEQFLKGSSIIKDDRQAALDHCIQKKLAFTSTWNSISRLIPMCFKIQCPYCQQEMLIRAVTTTDAGTNIEFTCKNHHSLHLRMPLDGISVLPRD